jgi:hypothetical protein
MDPAALIANIIISRTFGTIIETVKSGLKEVLEPEFRSLERRINDLHASVQLQQAMWLKSGLTFLKLGEVVKARDEFIRAEASDKRSAVARFYLSLLLAYEGKLELAREKLHDAILINPFVSLLELRKWDRLPANYKSKSKLPSKKWARHLNSEQSIKAIPESQHWVYKFLLDIGDKGAITKCSCSGGGPVISWRLNSQFDFDDDHKRVISALDFSTGKILWSSVVADKELHLVTPTYVILKTNSENSYDLLSIKNGKSEGAMSADYYETVFCPDPGELQKLEEFKRSNRSMLTAKVIETYKQNRERQIKSKWGFAEKIFKTLFSSIDFKYLDQVALTDPLNANLYKFHFANYWKKDYILRPSMGQPSSEEIIGCDAKVQRLK